MNEDLAGAYIGLLGVGIGALVSLIGTVVIPWIRDSNDRKRIEKKALEQERRTALLSAMAALAEMHQSRGSLEDRGKAQVRFMTQLNELTLRLDPTEDDVRAMLVLMLVMVQASRPGVENMTAETMMVLTLWSRGDIAIEEVVPEVERRAGVDVSADRLTATPRARPAG